MHCDSRMWAKSSMERMREFTGDESGASAVEYSLLLVGIAITIAGTVSIFGNVAVKGLFNAASSIFPS